MVRRNRARSSSLFLMELIIAILFFSASSAVCVQFFVKSHLMSNDSNALNHAVNECAGAAEIIDTADSIEDSVNMMKRLYPNGSYPEVQTDMKAADIEIYYNDSFEACISQDAAFILTLHMELNGQMVTADMQMSSSDSRANIYELPAKHHIARRTGYEER